MCGRFNLTVEARELAEAFRLQELPRLEPRYNIAPTQPVPVVRERAGGRELVELRWGLVPPWADDVKIGNRLINARVESAPSRPAFRDAFLHRRCVVPATGFYEWTGTGKAKQPWLVRRRDGRPFAMAGLWERWRGMESFTILTTDSAGPVVPLHERMPVVLPAEAIDPWLDPARDPRGSSASGASLDPDEWEAIPVRPAVNDPRHEGPECIEALALPAK